MSSHGSGRRCPGWAVRYTYSAEGDLVRVSDSARGTTVYHVDAAHRLVGETTPDGRALAYELDEANNVVAKPGLSRLELTSGNRLVGSDRERFEYDERDQLVMRRGHDGSVTRYTYDSFDMLVRLERWAPDGTPEPTFEYSHDALGRRLSVRAGAYAREFYWDGDRIAAEVFPNGRLRIYTYAGREALVPIGFTEYESRDAAPESGRAYFVYSDPVGMPLHIEDAAGEIVWWASRIDPYGLIEVHPSSQLEYNLRWPGHYYDPETGLHSNRYRVYDPVLGRYLQSDPLGYEGSDVNLYSYAPNPLVQVDVLGLDHEGRPKRSRSDGGGDNDGAEGVSRRGRQHHDTGEALDARYGLTKAQRQEMRARRAAAGSDSVALEQMRFDRTQMRRANLGMKPYPDIQAWRREVANRGTTTNRQRGTQVADTTRAGVSEHVGRPLASGDSLPDPSRPGQTTKYEVDVSGGGADGSTVRTRPDSITTDESGRPDPTGVVHDNKHFMGPGSQEYPETDQLRAQRALAERNGGRHVVSLSSDSPDLTGSPPRPRPDSSLGGSTSEIVYADPASGRVTHTWNPDTGRWDPV